jgi:hypothetical protein
MVTRGLVFLLLAACSNDQFSGADGSDDDAADAASPKEAAADDVVEASAVDSGPGGFCATQSNAFYCDDFDELPNPTDSFSVTTPAAPPTGTFVFGQGKSAKGLVVTASGALSTAYVTKQAQGSALHGFTFAIQIPAVQASATYVRVQAQSSAFTLAADGLAQNITIKGDSGNPKNLLKPDTSWHVFDVQLTNGNANVAVDGGSPVSVPFAAAGSTSSTLDLGIIAGALAGGAATYDDIALR